MHVNVIQPGDLTEELLQQWRRLQAGSDLLASPFLSPDYATAVAAVRDDVRIAVISEGGETSGFFPFQVDAGGIGQPIGLKLSDLQGAVIPDYVAWSADELLLHCGLRAWHFNHLIGAQRPFQPFHWALEPSHFVDLSEGFEGFRRSKQQSGSKLLSKMGRKKRKMQREVGPLRFEFRSNDRRALKQVLAWKSAQRRRTRTPDVLQFPWVMQLLEQLWRSDQPGCFAPLSCLYVGDRLVAAHLGLCSATMLHVWFPAYDPEFYKHSPGLLLMVEIMQAAAEAGIRRIELGRGGEGWKAECKNGTHMVAIGSVDRRPLIRSLRRRWYHVRNWIKASPLRGPVAVPKRILRRIQNWKLMR